MFYGAVHGAGKATAQLVDDELNNDELINSDFRAVPLSPATAPTMPEVPTLSQPPLPRVGCREYLLRARKMIELELSFRGVPNRAARRFFVRQVNFA